MQVEAALRQAEMVKWLASNPAQQTEASGRDPSVLLHRLQLGQASAPSTAGRQVLHPFIHGAYIVVAGESLYPAEGDAAATPAV